MAQANVDVFEADVVLVTVDDALAAAVTVLMMLEQLTIAVLDPHKAAVELINKQDGCIILHGRTQNAALQTIHHWWKPSLNVIHISTKFCTDSLPGVSLVLKAPVESSQLIAAVTGCIVDRNSEFSSWSQDFDRE